jgi:hypothetical protein
MPVTFNGLNIPEQLTSMLIEQLDLSVRSFNALERKGISTVGQLLLLSAQELLSFEAFGRKSLIDVQRALNLLLTSYRKSHDSDQASAHIDFPRKRTVQLCATSGGWLCPQNVSVDLDAPLGVLDLSARPTNALQHLGTKSVRQLMNLSKRDFGKLQNIGRTSVAEVQLKLSNYLSGAPLMAVLVADSLQRDRETVSVGTKTFVNSMLNRLPERSREVIADRYGLWDGIAETLQDIGDKLGRTRERVRQIEKKGLSRLQRIFGHLLLLELVAGKLSNFSLGDATGCGVLDDDEAISAMADDCSQEEAALALSLLNDIAHTREGFLAGSLIEAEPGVYCLSKKVASDYSVLVQLIKSILQKHQKPISEAKLRADMVAQMYHEFPPAELRLTERILSISPSVTRLRTGQIALSPWTEFQSRNASTLAEAALRLIGRPAHFREITEKINASAEVPKGVNERRVHNAIIRTPQKFVWVRSGTYGLAAWGIARPPYLKDRLVQLLSEARYPMPYWHLREKVLEVCNCKEASIRMTLDLNPRVFKKFENDHYGLCEHYVTTALRKADN